VPGVTLHMYGKVARPRRKVGHLCAAAATADDALERLAKARALVDAFARTPAAAANAE